MKPYKLALLTGTHQHRWPDDGSGVCEKCHREHSPHQYKSSGPGVCTVCGAEGKCPHNGGFYYANSGQHYCRLCYARLEHVKEFSATEALCWSCPVCSHQATIHSFTNGACTVCGWRCPHSDCRIKDIPDDIYHICRKCKMELEHVMEIRGTAQTCTVCSACGYTRKHLGINVLGDTCTVCGYTHDSHIWSGGNCIVCNAGCSHPAIGSNGVCTVCGMTMRRPGDTYYFYGTRGGYDGSYGLDRTLDYDDGDFCEVYKGYRYNAGTWTANGYNLFVFDVRKNITRFGGEYAYKLTGCVFTTANAVNVAPALLSANGVFDLKLAQYNLDGSLRDSSMDGYTSADCDPSSAYCPNFALWTP